TFVAPWAITSSSCCLNSGAVYRSTSPASEMTKTLSESCSVLMSKFMFVVSPRLDGASLLVLRTRRRSLRLWLQLLERRLRLGRLFVCGDRRGRVARALRDLGEPELRRHVFRVELRELLVDAHRVALEREDPRVGAPRGRADDGGDRGLDRVRLRGQRLSECGG